jgi:hypothetical protein
MSRGVCLLDQNVDMRMGMVFGEYYMLDGLIPLAFCRIYKAFLFLTITLKQLFSLQNNWLTTAVFLRFKRCSRSYAICSPLMARYQGLTRRNVESIRHHTKVRKPCSTNLLRV